MNNQTKKLIHIQIKKSKKKNLINNQESLCQKKGNESLLNFNHNKVYNIINKDEKLKDINNLFKVFNEKEINDFYVLLFFLMSLISITDKKKCIYILQKFRNKDVIIPNYISDSDIDEFYNKFKLYVPVLTKEIINYQPNELELIYLQHKKNKNSNSNFDMNNLIYGGLNNKTNESQNKLIKLQSGGYYFKRLEEKGDEPITGTDIARLLDEIQGITSSLRYTPDGRNLTMFDTLLGFFRGQEESLTSYLKFFVAPRFYTIFPFPMLKNIFSRPKPNTGEEKQLERFAGGAPLWERYEDIADYLLAYQSYDRAKKQYFVDEGLLSPDVLEPTFMEKLTGKLDVVATKYSQAKMVANKQIILGMY